LTNLPQVASFGKISATQVHLQIALQAHSGRLTVWIWHQWYSGKEKNGQAIRDVTFQPISQPVSIIGVFLDLFARSSSASSPSGALNIARKSAKNDRM
jgi:hypothetical protein